MDAFEGMRVCVVVNNHPRRGTSITTAVYLDDRPRGRHLVAGCLDLTKLCIHQAPATRPATCNTAITVFTNLAADRGAERISAGEQLTVGSRR